MCHYVNTTQLINELQPGEVCLVAGRPRTGRSSLIFNLWWQDSSTASSHLWCPIDILHDLAEKNRAFRYEEAAVRHAERGNRPALFRMEFFDAVDNETPSREEMNASFKELKRIASKGHFCSSVVYNWKKGEKAEIADHAF